MYDESVDAINSNLVRTTGNVTYLAVANNYDGSTYSLDSMIYEMRECPTPTPTAAPTPAPTAAPTSTHVASNSTV